MNVSRRWFIGGAAASLGALAGCQVFRAKPGLRKDGVAALTFGVVSDVHIRLSFTGKGLDKGHTCEALEHTFAYFRDQGVDAVMIAGDIADRGLVEELEAVADTWYRVFPNDRAPDGHKVERVFVYGNHDWEGFNYGSEIKNLYPDKNEFARRILRTNYAGNWERIFHEPYSAIYHKVVKGYSFVGAHWQVDKCRGRNERSFDHTGEWFAAHGRELDPALPFFYFQHPHPKDTVYGSWAWGHDSGVTTKALSAFPNAVAFSGHSHYTLTDERSIWQGTFTSLGTSSLRYTGLPYDQYKGIGYENARHGGELQMQPNLPTCGDGKQGMLVKVYGDCIVFHRREFVGDRPLGDDWVMPLPAAEPMPFAFGPRAIKAAVPAFGADAVVTVRKTQAKVRTNKKSKDKNAKRPAYEVTFSSALAEPKARTFEYEFTFTGSVKGSKPVVRHLLAAGCNLPALDARAQVATEKCLFPAERLPLPPFKVAIRPLSSIGRFGNAITAEVKA